MADLEPTFAKEYFARKCDILFETSLTFVNWSIPAMSWCWPVGNPYHIPMMTEECEVILSRSQCNQANWCCFNETGSAADLTRQVGLRSMNDWKHFCSLKAARLLRLKPDSKVHGANIGPTWVLSAPDGLHVGPMNLAIRGDTWQVTMSEGDVMLCHLRLKRSR